VQKSENDEMKQTDIYVPYLVTTIDKPMRRCAIAEIYVDSLLLFRFLNFTA